MRKTDFFYCVIIIAGTDEVASPRALLIETCARVVLDDGRYTYTVIGYIGESSSARGGEKKALLGGASFSDSFPRPADVPAAIRLFANNCDSELYIYRRPARCPSGRLANIGRAFRGDARARDERRGLGILTRAELIDAVAAAAARLFPRKIPK